MCSCYVPARNSDSNDDGEGRKDQKNQVFWSNKDGIFQGFRSDEARAKVDERNNANSFGNGCGGSNAPQVEPFPLKSNLKKSRREISDQIAEMRRVNWPDAYGKNIAHIQEFEPSVEDESELESVKNSCICAIQ